MHVSKELAPSEEQHLTANLEDLAETFKVQAEAALPQSCRIDVKIG